MLSLGIAMNVSYQEQMSKKGSMNAITVYPNWEQQVRPNEKRVEPKVSQEVLDQIKLTRMSRRSLLFTRPVKMESGKFFGYVQVTGSAAPCPIPNYNVSQGRL